MHGERSGTLGDMCLPGPPYCRSGGLGKPGPFRFPDITFSGACCDTPRSGTYQDLSILSLRSAKQNKISDALNVIADFMVLSRAPELSR